MDWANFAHESTKYINKHNTIQTTQLIIGHRQYYPFQQQVIVAKDKRNEWTNRQKSDKHKCLI